MIDQLTNNKGFELKKGMKAIYQPRPRLGLPTCEPQECEILEFMDPSIYGKHTVRIRIAESIKTASANSLRPL